GTAPSSFFFQAEDGIRAFHVTGVQTCALPISPSLPASGRRAALCRASLRRSGLVRHSAALRPLAGKLGEALGKVYRDKDVKLQLDRKSVVEGKRGDDEGGGGTKRGRGGRGSVA